MVELHPDLVGKEFDFDDFEFRTNITEFSGTDADLSTHYTRNVRILRPISSAAMDTLTEDRMAIQISLLGGIGNIHFNQSPEEQASQVERVKDYQAGFVQEPFTVSPDTPIAELLGKMQKRWYSTIFVTADGNPHGPFIGIITNKDFDQELHLGRRVKDRMTPFYLEGGSKNPDFVFVLESEMPRDYDERLRHANRTLLESHHGKMPILTDDYRLDSAVFRADIERNRMYQYATKDARKRLRVFGAVEANLAALDRMELLAHAGVDGFVVDTAHGSTTDVAALLKEAKKRYPGLDIVGGNVSTADETRYLIERGVDAVKVGQGVGSICTTISAIGAGRSCQPAAVYECAKEALRLREKHGFIPVIADGGIKEPVHGVKVIGLGAHSFMLGGALAGTEETPGEPFYDTDGQLKKRYRGMGSMEAMMEGGARRYSPINLADRVPEGIPTTVVYKGPLEPIFRQFVATLSKGFFYIGGRTIEEVHRNAFARPRHSKI